MNTLSPFEKEIKKIYHLPNINQSFFEQLETELQTCQLNRQEKRKCSFHLSLGWGFIIIVFFAIISFVIAIGPSKVLA
ncbi:MAG TPA: hypothetical protein PLG58_10425, partial [Flexilinea sp.]|nr:hypothetical protein [Flexilinea sp.]